MKSASLIQRGELLAPRSKRARRFGSAANVGGSTIDRDVDAVEHHDPTRDERGAGLTPIPVVPGHRDQITTQRFMLSPAIIDHAIRLLETPKSTPARGDIILETEKGRKADSNS